MFFRNLFADGMRPRLPTLRIVFLMCPKMDSALLSPAGRMKYRADSFTHGCFPFVNFRRVVTVALSNEFFSSFATGVHFFAVLHALQATLTSL